MIYLHIYKISNKTKQQSKQLLLKNISHYLQKKVNKSDITTNQNGKPEIDDIHFSISHSRDVIVQVFTKNQAIGVDVEFVNAKRNYQALAKRYFHHDESSLMKSLKPQKACRLFYDLWSLKEAVCKAEGGRLWYYLSQSYLDENNNIKKSVNGMTLTLINETKDYSMALASYSNSEIVVLS